LDALAVDVSAVGRAEIFNLDRFAVDDQAAMFSRDVRERDSQIAIFATTNDTHVARDRETAALAVRSEHDHHDAHCNYLSTAQPALRPHLPKVAHRCRAPNRGTCVAYNALALWTDSG